MPTITVSHSRQQLTTDDLTDVETNLGFVFPDSLKKFYLSHNGGTPYPSCFNKDNEYWQVNEFLPIKYGEKGDLFEDTFNILVAKGGDFFPRNLIPFAVDPGGDIFCFRDASGDIGAIYGWIADRYEDSEGSVVKLADNFETFIEQLVECP